MDILVSGAGIAGLSVALDLAGRGHRVTVVERASHLRVNGAPIDIRGDAISIADRMGLLTRIRENRVRMTELGRFVNGDGQAVAHVPAEEISDSEDDVEIAREDLARILAEALPSPTTIRFRDSIDSLADDGDGVDVRFGSGRTERFDLVLGADGLHSAVRRLAFGPERDYLHHLGFYVGLADLPGEARPDRLNPMYNVPGRMAGVARYKDKALAVFLFRSEPIDYDHRDLDAQKQILIDAFADNTSWKVPQLLDAVRADPEFYFDSVSQIHMPTWHRGRIGLVGDAAHCPALLSGRGTSLALTGAYFLAEELESSENHLLAFERYETRQRPHVEFAQSTVGEGGDLMVPPTWEAINTRNERLRAANAC
ncbi:FAD-dependent oxidoreductase [Amycolatopsis cihanbeyliensis]|uniref:2-polyprenyl-6-methoxyphenol hydroxylase-like FAD-dependent oxidoreductase n=1 Tax=Amycolatopsis cihanbeyliensis TaxID=1128664 RepID=A0A542DQS6_AMYCI|nr:FAD-dependent oxidoreductase [Amycolatopsis cihanbeyliensis]TQJ05461.1 2-polyprenyl-6-methoxyphenol hydroxylase-like FAD-dependent oxidoreductase [Amycolatopsis cihanbeyliensis]